LLVLAVVVIGASCSSPTNVPSSEFVGEAPVPSAATDPSPTARSAAPRDDARNDADVAPTPNGEPLLSVAEAEALTYAYGYYQWTVREFDDYLVALTQVEADREDSVLSCMRTEGFEYYPADLTQLAWLPQYSAEVGTREWAQRYGIGFSTVLFPQALLGEAAVGYLGPLRLEPDISETSEETRYLTSMSGAEYRLYSIALEGFDPAEIDLPLNTDGSVVLNAQGVVEMADSDDPAAFAASCRGQAWIQYPEPITVLDNQEEVAERVFGQRDWVDAQSLGWDCVRERGHLAANINDIRDLISVRQLELGMFGAQFGEISRNTTELPREFIELLVQVQDYERELAKVLWTCEIHPIQEQQLFLRLVDELTTE